MNKPAGKAFILRSSEGREIDMGEFRMSLKATGEATGGAFSLLEADEPPGFGPPLHMHHDAAESFYVLQGEYIMVVEEQEYACPAGSFVYIPAGMRHTFRVGEVPSRKLNIYTPAAMVGFFDDLSEAANKGEVAPETASQIAARYSMEVIGPVPERYV